MNAITHFHHVLFKAPYFSDQSGVHLQRYLVPEFMQGFERDLQTGNLASSELRRWRQEDRFSDHDELLVLRLPMHKTFYVVSYEVACMRLGQPALDEERITTAGFVIRKISKGKEYSWMLEEGQNLGWQESATGHRDPDVHRRMCRDGHLHPREDIPTYTGEQTHPLRPKTVKDSDGKTRTLLFGYLPLGGSHIVQTSNPEEAFDDESLASFQEAAAEHLPWPYGSRKPRDANNNKLPLNTTWYTRFTRPVTEGVPSKEFFELLRLLVNRYHLGELPQNKNEIEENEGLKDLAESLYFYTHEDSTRNLFNDYSRDSFNHLQRFSLYDWLQSHADKEDNDLVNWIAQTELDIDAAGGIDRVSFTKLPNKGNSSVMSFSLYNTPSDAREFRTLLDQRVLDNAVSLAKEIPVPKFQQSKDDIYQIVPFVRAEDDKGKERIYWGEAKDRSELFRVAAPFDANASRPSVIQMPSLRDIRKGLAKGVGMITPPDTFNLLNALNLKKGAGEDVVPDPPPESGGIGIQWICSFSIPVITLVAMILLMIMISLLNIIFFWLPWVKICLPFPKIK